MIQQHCSGAAWLCRSQQNGSYKPLAFSRFIHTEVSLRQSAVQTVNEHENLSDTSHTQRCVHLEQYITLSCCFPDGFVSAKTSPNTKMSTNLNKTNKRLRAATINSVQSTPNKQRKIKWCLTSHWHTIQQRAPSNCLNIHNRPTYNIVTIYSVSQKSSPCPLKLSEIFSFMLNLCNWKLSWPLPKHIPTLTPILVH